MEMREYKSITDLDDDVFEIDFNQFDELTDLFTYNDYGIIIFDDNKFMFSFKDGVLDVKSDADTYHKLIIEQYIDQYRQNRLLLYGLMMSGLIEGLVLVGISVRVALTNDEADALKFYNSITFFKTKQKEKKESGIKHFELIYISGDYHSNQLLNFCDKYNLKMEDFGPAKRQYIRDADEDIIVFVKKECGHFYLALESLHDFVTNVKLKDEYLEAKCTGMYLHIYRFNPDKYSKLRLIK